ncbi:MULTISPECIES: hypothetical protein [Klebsiella pneumoniae complex]|uniref:hypothetical protein n=1 Tax=Klebsiella pneumoniae complex TaxID=3390273 RepID=UPI000E2E3BC2|nr:hypothetical protein [Klebsiella variicola]MDE1621862.1 hypothetical protein [Klebsiella variicola]SXF54818.1 Uncharacterised protein [Klebsiella variicola]
MTSKFTREQLIKKAQEQIAFCRHTKITGEGLAHVNQCAALFEIALAAMGGEPRLHIKDQQAQVTEREPIAWLNDAYLARGVVDGEAGSEDAGPGYIPVYREAGPQPAPVVPDGYVMVPMRLTAENGAKGALSGEFSETKFVNCPECFGDDECETCDGSGRIEITVPVTWTTIKEIWAKGVEHFAAAPQEVK